VRRFVKETFDVRNFLQLIFEVFRACCFDAIEGSVESGDFSCIWLLAKNRDKIVFVEIRT